MVPTFFLLTPERRFHVIYEQPMDLDGSEGIEARVGGAMQAWAACLERRIREHPEQWYCFYPFWDASLTTDS